MCKAHIDVCGGSSEALSNGVVFLEALIPHDMLQMKTRPFKKYIRQRNRVNT